MGERGILVGAILIASACHSGRASTTTTSSNRPLRSDEAWARMTKARCDREIACDNVGHRKTFADRRACERELRARASTELTSRACPKGISEHHLEQCLSDVRRETCGNPFHTADRIENCSDAMLCVDD